MITQAYPTNFHDFWARLPLVGGRTIADYKEVTAAEAQAIKAQDAKWEEPARELVAHAASAGVPYNIETGYFELNGLYLTASDMRHVLNNYGCMHTKGRMPDLLARTNIREEYMSSYTSNAHYSANLNQKFMNHQNVEVVRLNKDAYFMPDNIDYAFNGCTKLREITGIITLHTGKYTDSTDGDAFTNCPALEEVRLRDQCAALKSVNWSACQKLSLASLQYLVTQKNVDTALTVTLHAQAYARLTDELLTQAAAKNITFATT